MKSRVTMDLVQGRAPATQALAEGVMA
jgi:hypothetical protein